MNGFARMTKRSGLLVLAGGLMFTFCGPVRAEDNTTQYFTGGGVSNVTDTLYVGNTGNNIERVRTSP